MLRFFRLIRRKLIEEENARKYFWYALGEVFLVVIGILIALQINNWNESRKGIEASRIFLEEMRDDLASDTLELGNKIRAIDRYAVYQRWYLSKKRFDLSDVDSLLSLSSGTFDFYMHDNTYQTMINSGNAKLLGYEHLDDDISRYYSELNRRAIKINDFEIREASRVSPLEYQIQADVDYIAGNLAVYLSDSLTAQFTGTISPEESRRRYIDYSNTVGARNEILMVYSRQQFLKEWFQLFYDEAEALLTAIDESLE